MLPGLQLDHLALVIHFFLTAYGRRFRLLANTLTAESTTTPAMIPALIPLNDNCGTMFSKVVPHPQINPICLFPTEASNVETWGVPLEMIEYRERRWCHDWRIVRTTVIYRPIQMHQKSLIVRQMQWIVSRTWMLIITQGATQLSQDWNTSEDEFNNRDRLTGTRILQYRTIPRIYSFNDGIDRFSNTAPPTQ